MAVPKKKAAKQQHPISLANATIDIDDIILSSDWNRVELGDVRELTQSIRARGQLVAVVVRCVDKYPGKVVAVDGRRRLAVMRSLGIKEVIISFTTADNDGDAFQDSMIANSNGKPNTPYELAISYEKLVVEHEKTTKEIAQSCGKTTGHVSQHRTALRISKTNRRLFSAFKRNTVPTAVFRHLAKLDATSEAKFLEKMIEHVLTGDQAQDIGEKIDEYLLKKSDTTEKKKQRGAAAHKKNITKPTLELVDYSDADVIRQVNPVKGRSKYQELLCFQTQKIRDAKKKDDQLFQQGVLLGLEMGAGIVEIED